MRHVLFALVGISGALFFFSLTRVSHRGHEGTPKTSHTRPDATIKPAYMEDPGQSRLRPSLFAHTEPGGLGHRVSALIFAYLAATEVNGHVKVSHSFWNEQRIGGKSYLWFADVLKLGLEEPPEGAPVIDDRRDITPALLEHHKKGIIVMSGHAKFCHGTYCANAAWPGAYKKSRSWFRNLVKLEEIPSPYLSEVELHCAWHLRIGDIILSTNAALIRLFDNVMRNTKDVAVHHHILSEKPLCRLSHGAGLFCQFDRHLKMNAFRVHYHHDVSDRDAFRYMVWSNILISTGSSFSFVAAQVSADSQVVVSMPAKETNGLSVYDRGDFVLANSDGSIEENDVKVLELRLKKILEEKESPGFWRLDRTYEEDIVDKAEPFEGEIPIQLDLLSACGCEGCVSYSFSAAKVFSVGETPCIVVEGLGGQSWLQYVSTEFGEILELLQRLPGYVPLRPRPTNASISTWFEGLCPNASFPSAVLFWESSTIGTKPLDAREGKQWKEAAQRTLICVFMDDLHYFDENGGRVKLAALERSHRIFATYAYKLSNWYPSINPDRVTWLPHSAGRNFLLTTLNVSARHSVLISGAMEELAYPCRAAVYRESKAHPTLFERLFHPGYGQRKLPPDHYPNKISEHQFGLATTMRINYVVAKVFEIPAVGTIALINNDMEDVLRGLGMIPQIHYIPFSCDMKPPPRSNLTETLKQLVSSQIRSIRTKGMQLMRAKHTVFHRAWQFHATIMARLELRHRKSVAYQPKGTLSHFSTQSLVHMGQCFGFNEQKDDWPEFLPRKLKAFLGEGAKEAIADG